MERTRIYKDRNVEIVKVKIPKRIGFESHEKTTQITKLVKGKGMAIVGSEIIPLDKEGVIIPPMYMHDIINIGKYPLEVINYYAPPH